MKWTPFALNGITYELSHLWPLTHVYEQAAKENKASRKVKIEFHFGLHCFTRGIRKQENPDYNYLYRDARETRVFDFERYELSKTLPCALRELHACRCYQTEPTNFYTSRMLDRGGETPEYYVNFFEVSRTERKGAVQVFVSSAHVRQELPRRARATNLFVILFKVLDRKPAKLRV